jgi:hypothetical protein
MDMSVIKPGHHKGAFQVDQFGARLFEPQNCGVVAGCDNLVAAHRKGRDPLRGMGKTNAGDNVTVVINGVYGGCGRE